MIRLLGSSWRSGSTTTGQGFPGNCLPKNVQLAGRPGKNQFVVKVRVRLLGLEVDLRLLYQWDVTIFTIILDSGVDRLLEFAITFVSFVSYQEVSSKETETSRETSRNRRNYSLRWS